MMGGMVDAFVETSSASTKKKKAIVDAFLI